MFEYFYVTFYKYYVIYRLIRNKIKYIVLNATLCLLPSQVYLHSNEIIYYPFIKCKQTCLIHYVFSCRHFFGLKWEQDKSFLVRLYISLSNNYYIGQFIACSCIYDPRMTLTFDLIVKLYAFVV